MTADWLGMERSFFPRCLYQNEIANGRAATAHSHKLVAIDNETNRRHGRLL
jgi:hypothetical protein